MNTKSQEPAVAPAPKAENNRRFRELVDCSGWTQAEILARFNKGMVRPVSMSAIKSWLSSSETSRFRPMSTGLLEHAEKVLAKAPKSATKQQ